MHLMSGEPFPALLAAVGLAHDLGNPPYGHQGERSIRLWFRSLKKTGREVPTDFLKFDGNCQTFRLLTKLQFLNDEYGLNLTYATLAALMKYPIFFDSDHGGFSKFGIFDSERDVAMDVWEHTGLSEGVRHPLAYLMEACDDIAYSVIDAEDTVKKGYASFYDLVDYLKSGDGDDALTGDVLKAALRKNDEFRGQGLSSRELNDLSMLMFRVKAIAVMVQSATDTFVENIDKVMSGRRHEKFELISASPSGALCERLKSFDKRFGFGHPNVLKLELEGHNHITDTMNLIWEGIEGWESGGPFANYAYGSISENYRRAYAASERTWADKAHLLCDVVSGMSDS